MTRYYLHGDQHEDGGDAWFCVTCDSFETRQHFYGAAHTQRHSTDYDLYERGLSSLKQALKNSGGRLWRPDHADNCVR